MSMTVKVHTRDNHHDRWWNECVGRSVKVVEKNATVYEVVEGSNAGCLINKTFAGVKHESNK